MYVPIFSLYGKFFKECFFVTDCINQVLGKIVAISKVNRISVVAYYRIHVFSLIKNKTIQKQTDELDKNINTLNETKRQRKSLPEDRQAVLDELVHKRAEMGDEASSLKAESDAIQTYLNNLKVKGKVSVSGKIYPGTEIVIRDIREKIKNEYKGLTFYLENMMIKTTKYEDFDDDILRKGPPDAH